MKAVLRYPNFILGLISFLFLLVGVAFKANGYKGSDYIILSAIILGAIHWIWSIVEVAKASPRLKTFWLMIVIIVPPVGGMIYYIANAESKTGIKSP
ncbi:MAG: hypothetical protein NVS1B13_17790 [Flavisolibacter sp.]